MNSLLEESMMVTSADTDFTQSLKASALVNMLIQVAWHHADMLGFGKEFLHSNGLVWMLSRMHVKINNQPAWNSKLHIRTWPKGIRRLFYLRDFIVYETPEQPVAQATSEWLIIDLQARRPKLYFPENTLFRENEDRHALADEVPVLNCPDSKYVTFSSKVVYSDIDLNNHLTTTRYIDWMMDTFGLDFLENHRCSTIVIHFIKEVPYGVQVLIKRYELPEDHAYIFEFATEDASRILFRAQIQFSSV